MEDNIMIITENLNNTNREAAEKELHVPIPEKMLLTIREAAEYTNIGMNKIESLLKTPRCEFVLFVGTKKLVKRQKFEDFLQKQLII